jgi:hypothetical protein
MTQPNIFQEVEEDLERQKLEAMWRNYAPTIIGCALIVILATAGMTAYRAYRSGQEQKATGALMAIINQQNAAPAAQIDALENFADKNKGETQAVFARLEAAGLSVKSGDMKKAAEIYDSVASDNKVDSVFRQEADLLSVGVQMDSGDPVLLQKRLQPLLADNAPWRPTAMEYTAFLALRAGDKAKAKQLFTDLSQDASVPQSLAARAGDMARYLGE